MYYFIVLLVIIMDQLSKLIIVNNVKPLVTIPIIENVFHLTYAENTGAAFSIFSNKLPVLIGVTAIFILFLFIYQYITIKKGEHPLISVALSCIIGGALGNLLDRVRLGYVVDFFDFRLIRFAIFNLADTFIVVGSILLMIMIIIEEK
ncbi:MAG: signal peptidase II [Eubacteriales bacterium]